MAKAKLDLSAQPSINRAWQSYATLVLPKDAPTIQYRECKLAFFAGATTLFYAIMASLDPGDEVTEADLARMDNIHEEIDTFAKTFDNEVLNCKLKYTSE